jgi:hypothetical protein
MTICGTAMGSIIIRLARLLPQNLCRTSAKVAGITSAMVRAMVAVAIMSEFRVGRSQVGSVK